MQPGETPYEYFNNKLGVKVKFLVCDNDKRHNDSLNLIKYRSLSHRTKSKTCTEKQLRRASLGFDALVEYNSLDIEWRNLLNITFGKPKEEIKKSWFASHYVADDEAFRYFSSYRYGKYDEKKLPPEVIELYTINAGVLNTVLEVKTNRKAYARALNVTQLDIWESLSNDVNAFNEVAHNLPTKRDTLRHKATRYKKEGYASIISGKYGNKNGTKVNSREQQALIEELLKKHQNLDNAQIADIYNLVAQKSGWKSITSSTIANHREKLGLYTYAGRRGATNFRNQKAMQVKRTRPSLPMIFWTVDGWDVELLYQKETVNKKGHKVTTYHNRLTTVMVLDPFNNYPIGYAIGTNESPALIKEALRNAINHTKKLFGERFKPYQLQTDNYQIKNLKPLYQATTKHFTPARVRNSKSKVIEPFFNRFNKKHFQAKMLPNWSGHNVNSKKDNQPNSDYLNVIRHQFPDEIGCRMQIINAIEAERAEKVQAYVESWEKLPAEDRCVFPLTEYLRWYGETTGYTNKLQPQGLTPTIRGLEYSYDSFDLNFRKYAYVDWSVRYDPDDLSQILVVNAESRNGKLISEIDTLEFVLEQKYDQPMALYDRKGGDAKELQKVFGFNNNAETEIIERGADNNKVLEDFFNGNPELEVLQKMQITDSTGQHKNQKSAARLNKNPKVKELPQQKEWVTATDDFEIIDDVRSRY